MVFAWVYPHFLVGRSPLAYLVGSPMGLIPCPTLALVMGLALVAGGPGGRSTSLLLALAGLFYAVFGVARLGVVLDVALLAGPVGLLALGARATRPA